MKIGMVTQWFDPETGPAALPGVYAREFVKLGNQVRVLTGFPNYPDGRLYPGYRMRIRSREVASGVSVIRVPLYPNHGRSAMRRTANYGSYAVSAATLGTGALAGADGIWVYNSPLTVSLPLFTQSRFGRIPYFLHLQDLWPDSLVKSGMFSGRGTPFRVAIKVIEAVTRLTETRAHSIGVISASVKGLILERNPKVNPDRIHCVLNPADEELFFPRPPEPALERAPWRRPFTLMYTGAVGEVQGLDTLLDAAIALETRPEIGFVIVGDGIASERLRQRVADERIGNVWLLGRIAKELVPAYMASSDAQFVSLRGDEFLRYTTPSKISTILASGLPIVGQIAGDGAALIEASGSGVVAPPGDVDCLCEAICAVADLSVAERAAMGKRGRDFYKVTMSSEAAASAIIGALRTGPQY